MTAVSLPHSADGAGTSPDGMSDPLIAHRSDGRRCRGRDDDELW